MTLPKPPDNRIPKSMSDAGADHRAGIDVQFASGCQPLPDQQQLRAWAEATLAFEGRSGAALCMRVVDEEEGRNLNARFRGIDRATNVLSFAADQEGLPEELTPLGDILLCAPVVVQEAQQQRKPVSDHWAHLVVHGVLHLLGYDHESEDEARTMEGREIDVLERLGIPNPYRQPQVADP
jgi:probable rRNA maturation factor